jgi:hypothetical protein
MSESVRLDGFKSVIAGPETGEAFSSGVKSVGDGIAKSTVTQGISAVHSAIESFGSIHSTLLNTLPGSAPSIAGPATSPAPADYLRQFAKAFSGESILQKNFVVPFADLLKNLENPNLNSAAAIATFSKNLTRAAGGYSPGNFAFSLDGVSTGYLKSVEGGDIDAEVVSEKKPNTTLTRDPITSPGLGSVHLPPPNLQEQLETLFRMNATVRKIVEANQDLAGRMIFGKLS